MFPKAEGHRGLASNSLRGLPHDRLAELLQQTRGRNGVSGPPALLEFTGVNNRCIFLMAVLCGPWVRKLEPGGTPHSFRKGGKEKVCVCGGGYWQIARG